MCLRLLELASTSTWPLNAFLWFVGGLLVGAAWVPRIACSGHSGPVEDVAWDPTGRFVVSVSHDQTTRLFGRWQPGPAAPPTWHELARPQVHGYDMTCVAFVRPHVLLSGADEKVRQK